MCFLDRFKSFKTGLEGEESVDAVLTSPDKETEMSPDLEASNKNTKHE